MLHYKMCGMNCNSPKILSIGIKLFDPLHLAGGSNFFSFWTTEGKVIFKSMLMLPRLTISRLIIMPSNIKPSLFMVTCVVIGISLVDKRFI